MTLVNELDAAEFPYKNKYLITNLAYKNINSSEAYHLIKESPGLVIIDIRTEAEFVSKDSVQQNNIGHLKNAINIPQAQFAEKFDSYRIPQGSPILVYDQKGYNSMDVVDILKAKGFNQIYNLFEGLEVFISSYELNKGEISSVVTNPPRFKSSIPKNALNYYNSQGLVILDTRSADEFQNKASMSHMNLGKIKGQLIYLHWHP
jgi:rhodanese-related sulfurtransferase